MRNVVIAPRWSFQSKKSCIIQNFTENKKNYYTLKCTQPGITTLLNVHSQSKLFNSSPTSIFYNLAIWLSFNAAEIIQLFSLGAPSKWGCCWNTEEFRTSFIIFCYILAQKFTKNAQIKGSQTIKKKQKLKWKRL